MTCLDDMQMTFACGQCVDDVHVMPGVVLHEIWQLRQEDAILNTALHKAENGFLVYLLHLVKINDND